MILTAIFTAKTGKRDELAGYLHSGARESRKEPGVKFYLINDVEDSPNSFMNIEVYESEEAFQAHLKEPYVVELLSKLNDLLEVPLVIYKGLEKFNNEGPKSAL